ncbi:hypothetical protein, partial [Pseudomonas sp. MF6396]|uniref:hypothetical protein n=2 Tax=Pseudomonas TaxID=286 RepID=UPI00129067F4
MSRLCSGRLKRWARRSRYLDPVRRFTSRIPSQGEQREEETFAYDGNGRLIQAINAASKLQWFHDEAGNLVREHQHYLATGTPM